MNSFAHLPAMACHEMHKKSLMALMAATLTGQPVVGVQAEECERFLNAVAAAINLDPSLCVEIERAAATIR